MIYPDVSLEEWLKKYPELDLLEKDCDNCGKLMVADRPFLVKGFAGVISSNCECGKNRSICSSRISTSEAEHKRWAKILGEL